MTFTIPCVVVLCVLIYAGVCGCLNSISIILIRIYFCPFKHTAPNSASVAEDSMFLSKTFRMYTQKMIGREVFGDILVATELISR